MGDIAAARHTPAIEYHFCEYVAKEFMEDRRWEEVFHEIYGSFPKYGGKIENGEIGLPMKNSKLILPCGIFGRWDN